MRDKNSINTSYIILKVDHINHNQKRYFKFVLFNLELIWKKVLMK